MSVSQTIKSKPFIDEYHQIVVSMFKVFQRRLLKFYKQEPANEPSFYKILHQLIFGMKQLEANISIEPKYSTHLGDIIDYFHFKFDDKEIEQINMNDIQYYSSAFVTQLDVNKNNQPLPPRARDKTNSIYKNNTNIKILNNISKNIKDRQKGKYQSPVTRTSQSPNNVNNKLNFSFSQSQSSKSKPLTKYPFNYQVKNDPTKPKTAGEKNNRKLSPEQNQKIDSIALLANQKAEEVFQRNGLKHHVESMNKYQQIQDISKLENPQSQSKQRQIGSSASKRTNYQQELSIKKGKKEDSQKEIRLYVHKEKNPQKEEEEQIKCLENILEKKIQ